MRVFFTDDIELTWLAIGIIARSGLLQEYWYSKSFFAPVFKSPGFRLALPLGAHVSFLGPC